MSIICFLCSDILDTSCKQSDEINSSKESLHRICFVSYTFVVCKFVNYFPLLNFNKVFANCSTDSSLLKFMYNHYIEFYLNIT